MFLQDSIRPGCLLSAPPLAQAPSSPAHTPHQPVFCRPLPSWEQRQQQQSPSAASHQCAVLSQLAWADCAPRGWTGWPAPSTPPQQPPSLPCRHADASGLGCPASLVSLLAWTSGAGPRQRGRLGALSFPSSWLLSGSSQQGRRGPAARAAGTFHRAARASAGQSPQMCAIDASRAELSIGACIDGVCMRAFPSNLALKSLLSCLGVEFGTLLSVKILLQIIL